MIKFSVIIDRSFGDNAVSIDAGTVWLIDSAINRAAADRRRQAHQGQVSAVLFGDPSKSDDEAAIEALQGISAASPAWDVIDYLGMQASPTLVPRLIMPHGILSGLYIAKLKSGFRLQKAPPPARSDRFEIWRRHSPPRGSVRITDRALGRITELRDHLHRQEPDEDWVAALNWGSRSSRGAKDETWRDLGPGFDLGFFPRGKVPPDIIERHEDVEVILRLGLDPGRFAGKEIDHVSGFGFVLIE